MINKAIDTSNNKKQIMFISNNIILCIPLLMNVADSKSFLNINKDKNNLNVLFDIKPITNSVISIVGFNNNNNNDQETNIRPNQSNSN